MSRYQKDIITKKRPADIKKIVGGFMAREGFDKVVYEGRETWKKGQGFMISPQFIIIDVENGVIHLEAWIRFALLPGLYFGELGTEGYLGAVPKRKLKARLEELERLLTS